MPHHIVVIGMGQLGALFAKGFQSSGAAVTPILRGGDIRRVCEDARPSAVLVATGEDDLDAALGQLPLFVRNRVLLIQNELRPSQWQKHDIDPTVAIVWFEKRQDTPPSIVLPSVLFGAKTPLFDEAFAKLALPRRTIESRDELAHELVLKNLYILGLNLAGLRVGGVAQDLLTVHEAFFDSVLAELLPLEVALMDEAPPFEGRSLDEARLIHDLKSALLADPKHGTRGRAAPRRLARTLENAARLGIKTPTLNELFQQIQ